MAQTPFTPTPLDKSAAKTVTLKIYEAEQEVQTISRPMYCAILGRRDAGEPEPYGVCGVNGGIKIVLANIQERSVSRQHASLTLLSDGRVRIKNLSRVQPIIADSSRPLLPGEDRTVYFPVTLTMGKKTVLADLGNPDEGSTLQVKTLLHSPLPSEGAETNSVFGMHTESLLSVQRSKIDKSSIDKELLLNWLRTITKVLLSSAATDTFLEEAVRAVADVAGVDVAAALTLERNGEWMVQEFYGVRKDEWRPQDAVLAEMFRTRKTLWTENAVVSPILTSDCRVIGALYGDFEEGTRSGKRELSPFEGGLVDIIACSVATGMARQEQERVMVQERVRFEQFFTRKLARELEINQNLLKGKLAEVSVLFCDIRNFSKICETLNPHDAVAWINDVMDMLSGCVQEQDGVLVDYVGDEMFAMWGAPAEQPNHAELACQAALQMLERLPEIDDTWLERLNITTNVGIGVNSGPALVGNTGSHRKFKYGPIGNTVNVGSRVQGATKYFGRPLLITEHTQVLLHDKFESRRLRNVVVQNIKEPVCLFDVACPTDQDFASLKLDYEAALVDFENGDVKSGKKRLGNLMGRFSEDIPTERLMESMINARDPIWTLSGK